MLKTCGPVDLLNDYKKYGDLIMGKASSTMVYVLILLERSLCFYQVSHSHSPIVD